VTYAARFLARTPVDTKRFGIAEDARWRHESGSVAIDDVAGCGVPGLGSYRQQGRPARFVTIRLRRSRTDRRRDVVDPWGEQQRVRTVGASPQSGRSAPASLLERGSRDLPGGHPRDESDRRQIEREEIDEND
jgi:hypothetical protein